MNNDEKLNILKMMFYKSQMKDIVPPATYDEEQEIERKHNEKFPNKIFKMKWMNWSGGPSIGVLFPKREETWILDDKGNLGYYAKYEDGKISDVITRELKKEVYDNCIALITENFEAEESDRNCSDGEGWEMLLYDGNGNVMHEICGYIYGNEYLNKVVECIKNAHEVCRFM